MFPDKVLAWVIQHSPKQDRGIFQLVWLPANTQIECNHPEFLIFREFSSVDSASIGLMDRNLLPTNLALHVVSWLGEKSQQQIINTPQTNRPTNQPTNQTPLQSIYSVQHFSSLSK